MPWENEYPPTWNILAIFMDVLMALVILFGLGFILEGAVDWTEKESKNNDGEKL